MKKGVCTYLNVMSRDGSLPKLTILQGVHVLSHQAEKYTKHLQNSLIGNRGKDIPSKERGLMGGGRNLKITPGHGERKWVNGIGFG